MSRLSDLLSPGLADEAQSLPTLMAATVIDTDPLRVTVPSIDGGKHAMAAVGWLEVEEGDAVRVMVDETGGVVVVARDHPGHPGGGGGGDAEIPLAEAYDNFTNSPLGAPVTADSGQAYHVTGAVPLTVQNSGGKKVLTHSLVSGSGAGYAQLPLTGPGRWAFARVRFQNGAAANSVICMAFPDQSIALGGIPEIAPHAVFRPDGYWEAGVWEGTPTASYDLTGDSGALNGFSTLGIAPHDGVTECLMGFTVDENGLLRMLLPNGDVVITQDARYRSKAGPWAFIEIQVGDAAADAKPEIIEWRAGTDESEAAQFLFDWGQTAELVHRMLERYPTIALAVAFFQPLDADLSQIAALTPPTAGVLAGDGGNWATKTYAQVKTLLSIAIADVSGLTAALAAKIADPGGTSNQLLQYVGGAWTAVSDTTVVQTVLTALGIRNKRTMVHAATTAALANTPTYANGTAGVGATLTRTGNGAFPTIDGVAAALNNLYLVKDQASGLQNGVYKLTQLGSGSLPWILTRDTSFDQAAEIIAGDEIYVASGTLNGATTWVFTNTSAPTMGTTAITIAAHAGGILDKFRVRLSGTTKLDLSSTFFTLTIPLKISQALFRTAAVPGAYPYTITQTTPSVVRATNGGGETIILPLLSTNTGGEWRIESDNGVSELNPLTIELDATDISNGNVIETTGATSFVITQPNSFVVLRAEADGGFSSGTGLGWVIVGQKQATGNVIDTGTIATGGSDHTIETTLYGFNPLSQFLGDGRSLKARFLGDYAANGNNKKLRIKVDGQTVLDTGNITSGTKWKMELDLFDVDGGNAGYIAEWTCNDPALAPILVAGTLTGLASVPAISVTAIAPTTDGDIHILASHCVGFDRPS